MPATDLIEDLFETTEAVLAILDSQRELSLRNRVENDLRKTLALSAASRYEYQIRELLEKFCDHVGGGDARLVSLVRSKILDRQYHTLFAWDRHNANTFFALFGDSFKEVAKADVSASEQLDEAIRAFLELGRIRNELVHNDFATYPFNETSGEVLDLYRKARAFVTYLAGKLIDDD